MPALLAVAGVFFSPYVRVCTRERKAFARYTFNTNFVCKYLKPN